MYVYAPISREADLRAVFARMVRERLTASCMYAFARPRLDDWLGIVARARAAGGLLLGCRHAAGGELLAVGLFTPFFGQAWLFDFTVFRAHFREAVSMSRGGFAWLFAEKKATAIVGITPVSNRHALRLAEVCGFHVLGRIPGACRLARLHRNVDGVLVMCTPENLKEDDTMGFGGGGSTPSYTPAPAPKQQLATKSVTEAATSAREDQKDKAAKAAGLRASILTSQSPLNGSGTGSSILGG